MIRQDRNTQVITNFLPCSARDVKGKHAGEHRIQLGNCRERRVGRIGAVSDSTANSSLVLSPAKVCTRNYGEAIKLKVDSAHP